MAESNKNYPLSNLIKVPLNLLEEGLGSFPDLFNQTGLTVSEDDNQVYVSAHLPGLTQSDIKITMDENNIVWIKGEKKEEASDKEKRFYQKATSSFSYKVSLPKNTDFTKEPEATFENGELKITFKKTASKAAKEIQIKKKTGNG